MTDIYRRRIFKFDLSVEPRFLVQMPKGAEVISVGSQGPLPYMWAICDDRQPFEPRVFRHVTTGDIFNEERLWFHGHVKLGKPPEEPWYEYFLFEVEQSIIPLEQDPIEVRVDEDLKQIQSEYEEVYGVAAQRSV